jgi:hypothetical protein
LQLCREKLARESLAERRQLSKASMTSWELKRCSFGTLPNLGLQSTVSAGLSVPTMHAVVSHHKLAEMS